MAEKPFEDDDAMKSFVIASVDGITELLKTVSHPKRLEILSLMINKKYEFKQLMEETDLPKSALSNHISALVEQNLIKKIDRGEYDITIDGIEIIQNFSHLYLNMKIREQERLESQRRKNEALIARYTILRFNDGEIFSSELTKRSLKEMNIEIKRYPAFKMVGIVDRGNDGPKFIPQIWEKFHKRWNEVKDLSIEDAGFGVMDNFDKDGYFDYNAGVKITDSNNTPGGMKVWDIPEQRYVVFECTIPTIVNDIKHIFKEWFPQSDYEPTMGPEFEYYPKEFDNENNKSFLYYIPLKEKEK